MSDHAYRMLILAGPSGSGKSTLISHLRTHCPDIYFSISTTTRPRRKGEIEGQHYHFVSEEVFLKGIENKQFLEWARVHGHYYGTSLDLINAALKAGKMVLFDIDVQGHRSIKEVYQKATSIFITTKNIHILKERLEQRRTDSYEVIARRLQTALQEIQEVDLFDYVLVNEDLELSKKIVLEVAHTLGYKQQMFPKEAFCQAWGASHQ
ncbi:guanylate kinase [Helicobacter ailurogastricus]|uniref:Guanylate kinase n=1 Tax=Helicobacter ailurogastricus TaxID=1578720 RepID=A0A0K2Y4C1_9HELI|nr:guanylate kinase [Helicobacter ailurogastricus]BDQ29093.1 guanylate kinase [Helicobacter ailurogastricus]CRF51980.1 Guanylate kinase [Helicobacter ailurogastricus]